MIKKNKRRKLFECHYYTHGVNVNITWNLYIYSSREKNNFRKLSFKVFNEFLLCKYIPTQRFIKTMNSFVEVGEKNQIKYYVIPGTTGAKKFMMFVLRQRKLKTFFWMWSWIFWAFVLNGKLILNW